MTDDPSRSSSPSFSSPSSSSELLERVRRLEEAFARIEARLASSIYANADGARITPPSGISALPPAAATARDVTEPSASGSVVDAHASTRPRQNADAKRTRRDLETHLGTYWLSRAGIAALITGIAFYITVHFGDFGAAARVALGYSVAAALSVLGFWIARRHRLFGELMFGGGLAVAYFVTYALHFVDAVRVIDNELAALVLLATSVLGIVVAAQRLRSETVAGIAMFLGFHASILGGTTGFTLVATSLLACGALFFVVKNSWVIVPLSSLVAVYASHLAWSLRVWPEAFTPAQSSGERLAMSIGSLLLYFAVFNAAWMVRPRALAPRAIVSFVLVAWLGLVALGTHDLARSDRPSLVVFLALTTVAMGATAAIAVRRNAGSAIVATYLALALMTGALTALEGLSGAALVVTLGALGAVGVAGGARFGLAIHGVGVGLLVSAMATTFVLGVAGAFVPLLLASAFIATVHVSQGRLVSPLALDGAAPSLPRALKAIAAAGAACALVRTMTAILPGTLTTLAWTTAAVMMVAVGLVLRARVLRVGGLCVIALGVGRLFVFDLAGLPVDQRILTFVLLGVALLALSFAYTRFREAIDPWS